MVFLILFVCITAPARLAFTETDSVEWIILESAIDVMFFVDLVLNFFMAYHDEEFTLIDDRKVAPLFRKISLENRSELPANVVLH